MSAIVKFTRAVRPAVRVVGHRPTRKLRDAIKAVEEGRVEEYASPAAFRRAVEADIAKRRGG